MPSAAAQAEPETPESAQEGSPEDEETQQTPPPEGQLEPTEPAVPEPPAGVLPPSPSIEVPERMSRDTAQANPQGATPAPPEQEKPKEEPTIQVTAAPGKGVTFTSSDNRFSVLFKTRAQLRYTFLHSDTGSTGEINVKTLRFSTSGHILDPDFKFAVQLAFGGGDFEQGNSSPIFDAYLEYVKLRDLNVRFGQYFVPFDRARTMREFALQMVDRPQVVRELTLDRDMGLMLSSTDLFGSKVLGYHFFVGGGNGKNHFGGEKPGPIVVGRLVLRPWGTFDDDNEGDLSREKRPRLAFGIGGAYNSNTNRQNSTYGTQFRFGTVDYTNADADLVFKYAGFSFLGEGVLRHASENSLQGMVNGMPQTEYTRSDYGYLVQGGMMVHRLVEVTGRWEQLFAWDKNTDPQLQTLVNTQGNQLGSGVNLYLNGHQCKLQADYFYIFGNDFSEGRHQARLQLDASF